MKKSVSRIIAFLCVFALVICHFAGCGNNREDAEIPDDSQISETPAKDVSDEPDNSWMDEISDKSKDPNV